MSSGYPIIIFKVRLSMLRIQPLLSTASSSSVPSAARSSSTHCFHAFCGLPGGHWSGTFTLTPHLHATLPSLHMLKPPSFLILSTVHSYPSTHILSPPHWTPSLHTFSCSCLVWTEDRLEAVIQYEPKTVFLREYIKYRAYKYQTVGTRHWPEANLCPQREN